MARYYKGDYGRKLDADPHSGLKSMFPAPAQPEAASQAIGCDACGTTRQTVVLHAQEEGLPVDACVCCDN